MIANLDIFPSDTRSVSLDEILGEVTYLCNGALLWEAKAHMCAEAITVFSDAASCKLNFTGIVTCDRGEYILAVLGCI